MAGLDWHRRQRAAGELAVLALRLDERGYRLVSREDNPLCEHCAEFTLVRLRCGACMILGGTVGWRSSIRVRKWKGKKLRCLAWLVASENGRMCPVRPIESAHTWAKRQKRNSTGTSRLVTHDTTIPARACLSSQSETG